MQGGLRSGGGDGARGRPHPPGYGRPRARAALVQEHAHDPRRGRRRGGPRLRLRHRGALRRADARGGRGLGDPTQREQRGLREAHSRAYAPPGEDTSERGRGRAAGRPRRRGRRGPERGHPGAGERRLERLDRRAGRRRASGAHGGVAAQDPPPPRVDAASGARGTGVGTVRSGPDVHQGPGHFGIRRSGGSSGFVALDLVTVITTGESRVGA